MTRQELQRAAQDACDVALRLLGFDTYAVVVVVTALADAPGSRAPVGLASNLKDAAACRIVVQLGAGLAARGIT